MEKERKITAPEGCEIEKVEIVDGVAVVTFKEKERKLPKSWEESCKMYPVRVGECVINILSGIDDYGVPERRDALEDRNILPDRATAEAVLALCQLIQLRNAYNGDWVPDYTIGETKFTIEFDNNRIVKNTTKYWPCILVFKSEELCDEFLCNFRQLIEKLKPLYGIKKGGEK